jgi:cell surface protein SprA
MSHSEAINFRATVEPFPDLKIDVNANRTYSERTTEFYNYNTTPDRGDDLVNKSVRGNFTMSINTIKTAFGKMGNDAKAPISEPFEKLKLNRMVIAKRLQALRPANPAQDYTQTPDPVTGFPEGFGPSSPEVLVPAFIAAYTGQSADKVALSPFPSLIHMRPNWRVTYEGVVAQSEFLKRYFKSLSFNHAYRSSYNVGSFISNLDYAEKEDGFSYARRTIEGRNGDFIAPNDINSVSISEQLSPLIGLEITWINDFETRAELKTSRNLALSFSNNQLMEVLSNEMVFGLGYRFTKMDLIIKTKKSQKAYSNDLNIRADLSFRKSKTTLRGLDEQPQLTARQGSVTLKTTADYMLSDRFQLRLYFDKILNTPYKGSFKTANTNLGVSFRFTLAQ